MWSSFSQECLDLFLSLIFLLAALKSCLNHKGSHTMLSYWELPLERWMGHDLFSFSSGFPIRYLTFLSLCQDGGEGFKEFPEGTFRKWLILFVEILNVYAASICNLVVTSLPIYSHCQCTLSPPEFPILDPVHSCGFFKATQRAGFGLICQLINKSSGISTGKYLVKGVVKVDFVLYS